jgi:hypothetical protein
MQKPTRHPWRLPEITPGLKCQRTTDTVLHSTPEIRHLKFQEPFQFLQPALSRDRPLSGSGNQPSTINHQPRTS